VGGWVLRGQQHSAAGVFSFVAVWLKSCEPPAVFAECCSTPTCGNMHLCRGVLTALGVASCIADRSGARAAEKGSGLACKFQYLNVIHSLLLQSNRRSIVGRNGCRTGNFLTRFVCPIISRTANQTCKTSQSSQKLRTCCFCNAVRLVELRPCSSGALPCCVQVGADNDYMHWFEHDALLMKTAASCSQSRSWWAAGSSCSCD
jgi:hypothetical protein